MGLKRMGRPRKPLSEAPAPFTRRVRELIDLVHGGNVNEAAKATGLPAATVRSLYSGRTANPELRTIECLGRVYGVSSDWFIGKADSSAVPAIGLEYLISRGDTRGDLPRRVIIPWAAWPLTAIIEHFRGIVSELPPTARSELNLEDSSGQSPADAALLFLLRPLDSAYRLRGESEAPTHLFAQGTLPGDGLLLRELQGLGRFWGMALGRLVGHDAQ